MESFFPSTAAPALVSDRGAAAARRRGWLIAALLFLATLLNYLDRQVLSLVSPVLRAQFSLSALRYAHLLDAFLLGYTCMQMLAGWIVDRLGARLGLLLAMLWWSGAGTTAAFIRTPGQLAACLFLMGLGEAANWPSAVKAISEWFPAERRALAIGFFNTGSSAGAVLAPVIVIALTRHYSWRAAFLICGLLALLWVGPWRLLYTRPSFTQQNPAARALRLAALRDRRAWGVILSRFFADSIWFFYIFWLPDYLTHVQAVPLSELARIAWIPFLAAGVGNFAGGWASGFLILRRVAPVPARLAVMAAAALAMACGIAIRLCHSAFAAITLISIIVFAYSAWAANVLTLPGDLFASDSVATVTGVAGTVAGVGGMLSTALAGYLIDHYSYGPVFIGLACLPLFALSAACLSLSRFPIRRSENPPCS